MIDIEELRQIARQGELDNIKQINKRILDAAKQGKYKYQIPECMPTTTFIYLYYERRGFQVNRIKNLISWDLEDLKQ